MRRWPRPTIKALDPAKGEDFTGWATSEAGQEVLARVLAADVAPTTAAAEVRRLRRRPLLFRPVLAVVAVSLVLLISFSFLPRVFVHEPARPPVSGPVTSGPSTVSPDLSALQKLSVLLLSAGIAAPASPPDSPGTFASVDTLMKEIKALSARIDAGTLAGQGSPADSGLALAILADLRTALERADISVVLAGEITPEERVTLRREITSFPEVRGSAYLNAEDAWTQVKKELPADVIARIEQNPLQGSIEVDVVSPELMSAVAVRIEGLPGVRKVIYGPTLARAVIEAVQDNLFPRIDR